MDFKITLTDSFTVMSCLSVKQTKWTSLPFLELKMVLVYVLLMVQTISSFSMLLHGQTFHLLMSLVWWTKRLLKCIRQHLIVSFTWTEVLLTSFKMIFNYLSLHKIKNGSKFLAYLLQPFSINLSKLLKMQLMISNQNFRLCYTSIQF